MTQAPQRPRPRPLALVMEGETLVHPRNKSEIRLIRLLGKGGFGQVWEGEVVGLGKLAGSETLFVGKRVAVKLAVKRARDMLSEFAILSKLGRRGVVQGVTMTLEDLSNPRDPEQPWVVQEMLGQSLSSYVRAKGRLSIENVLYMGLCLLNTIEQVHDAGFVHQDIKPDNIMLLTPDSRLDQCGEIYYIDFGGACDRDTRVSKSNPCRMVGTPGYMSIRQQTQGGKPVFRDDIETIVYTCLRCVVETLPWTAQHVSDETKYSYYRRMVDEKRQFGINQLIQYFGPVGYTPFAMMLLEGRAAGNGPINYALIREAFEAALRTLQYTRAIPAASPRKHPGSPRKHPGSLAPRKHPGSPKKLTV